MAFDFPSSPNLGDLYQDATTGAVYRWNGYAWIGGVTGLGLQQVKETRYLTAMTGTHTRDPKCNGFADIYLMGGCGARIAVTWATGQVVLVGQPGFPATTIKYKYALGPSCPVVVGGGAAANGPGGASSFDTVLTAAGSQSSTASTVASTVSGAATGGAGGVAGSSGDENYAGAPGANAMFVASQTGIGSPYGYVNLRDCTRLIPPATLSSAASIAAFPGPAGAVMVVEYLNP